MKTSLKPLNQYTPAERGDIPADEEAIVPYRDDPSEEVRRTVQKTFTSSENSSDTERPSDSDEPHPVIAEGSVDDIAVDSAIDNVGPVTSRDHKKVQGYQAGTRSLAADDTPDRPPSRMQAYKQSAADAVHRVEHKIDNRWDKIKQSSITQALAFSSWARSTSAAVFHALPAPLQKGLSQLGGGMKMVAVNIWACLNAPLAAILCSVLVATVPPLQRFFFTPGTFVNNSVSRAITQSGGVAVPLILVVLGANLARNTLPDEGEKPLEYKREERNMLISALVARMLLPTIIMAPILALTAKYVPISILGDPIFIIVCFLLSGAPSALQLAQMCQVNGVFVGAASRLLFHSYVIW